MRCRSEMHASFFLLAVFGYLAVLLSFGIAALFYRAGVRNIAWSSTVFDGKHVLKSDLSRFRYVWIAVSNVAVTLITFGLMRPWAAVRMARYVNDAHGHPVRWRCRRNPFGGREGRHGRRCRIHGVRGC